MTVEHIISSETIEGLLVADFEQDAVQLRGGSALRCYIKPVPNTPLTDAHEDAFQLIPPAPNNGQYALAILPPTSVKQCVVDGSTTAIQCVFGSDGIFEFVDITDNTLTTSGTHYVTLNGLLEGNISRNTFNEVESGHYPIKLYPARIGGNPDGAYQVWVLDFLDPSLRYQPITTDRPDLLQDNRFRVFNTNDKFLVNFDKVKFDKLVSQVPAGKGRVMGREFQRIALLCGDIVTEFTPKESGMTATIARKQFKASKEILEFIGRKENATGRLDLHQDPAGLLTIGYGHLITETEWNEGVIMIGEEAIPFNQQNLTPQQMQTLFAQDIEPREAELNQLMSSVPLSQNQFDALLSFVYNIGFGAFAGTKHNKPSTAYRRLLAGNFDDVPAAMKMWNKITLDRGTPQQRKVESKGLTIRRQEEADWFAGNAATDSRFPAPVAAVDEPVYYDDEPAKTKMYDDAYAAAYTDLKRQFTQDKPMEPQVHENKLDSTTLQGVLGMIVSAVFTYAVGKGWMPEGVSTLVQPIALEILGGVAGAFFSKRAWDGRLNAVKTFK